MAISATVTSQQITASVGESVIDVTVSGGIGPTGPAGPTGTTEWVGITGKPTAFNPAQHAATHAIGGVDYISPAAIGAATVQAAESIQLQVDGKAASSHTHPASAITSGVISSARLPVASQSQLGVVAAGTGLSSAAGVLSVSYGSSVGTSCQGSDPRLSDSREWSASTVSQEDAEAGAATDRRAFTVQRVWQAIAAWWNGSAAKAKLDGIAAGATANATDAQLRDRSTHTGTQTASTISDFTTAVIAAAPPTTNASLLTSGTLPDARLSSNIARTSDVTGAVAAVVNAAPASLDTLKELADALGNDASFATTVTNSLASKASTSDPRFSDAREWSADTVTQAEAEAGTSTTRRAFTAQRVFQAIAAWWATITVGTSKIADGAITAAKIASSQEVGFARVTATRASGTAIGVNNLTDGTVFSVNASTGGVSSNGSVICTDLQPSIPVAVTRGGTGATTASAARTNLGLGTAATSAATDFAAATHTHALSSLTQSGATTGQVAQWNGAAWVPATAGGSSAAVLSDTVGSTSYIGQAAPGSATSASVWKIRRTVLTSAGAVSSTATATSVKWDDRLTASYS